MNKFWLSFLFAFLSFALSILSLCVSYPRHEGLGFDYNGIIVSIFSLLVTLLIGWNIYNLIDFNRQRNSINDRINEVKNDLNKESDRLDTQLNVCCKNAKQDIKTLSEHFSSLNDKLIKTNLFVKKQTALSLSQTTEVYAANLKGNGEIEKYRFVILTIDSIALWADVQMYGHCEAMILLLRNTISKPEDMFLSKERKDRIKEHLNHIPNTNEIPRYDELIDFTVQLLNE